LLSLVGLSLSGNAEEEPEADDSKITPAKQDSKTKNLAIILLIAPAVLLIVILVVRKARQNKRSEQ